MNFPDEARAYYRFRFVGCLGRTDIWVMREPRREVTRGQINIQYGSSNANYTILRKPYTEYEDADLRVPTIPEVLALVRTFAPDWAAEHLGDSDA